MDRKKLIGTILGVAMFAALIAGATFAWFTFTVNITNGNYNAISQNFIINYTKGTDITDVPIVSSGTASNSKSLTVSAYRASTTATGTLYIKLTTTSSNTLTTSGALRYTVCSGTSSASGCTGNLTSGSTGVLSTGTISAKGEVTLYSVTIPTTQTYYWVHFWLDGATVTNSHLGMSYTGYIHASATQN